LRIIKKQGSYKIGLFIAPAIACQGTVIINTAHREWIRADVIDLPSEEQENEDGWENVSVFM
jgi:hypothetical protein